jgi:spore coat polysaccharide biosynthesis protein SpsF (cytidylyltransferase family)
MAQVLVCVQARSGSKRLPGKSLKLIDDKMMVEHVLDKVRASVGHINKGSAVTGVSANYAVLVPTGDVLKRELSGHCVVEGPEDDVLARFRLAFDMFNPDYVVRVTGDCPLIIPTIINKHITSAVSLGLDYCSNSYDDLRTFVDGYDCECISARAMQWLFGAVVDPTDREHVTTLIKRSPPDWAKFGVILSYLDLSDVKLSVDTKAELDEVKRRTKSLNLKCRLARDKEYAVFRF